MWWFLGILVVFVFVQIVGRSFRLRKDRQSRPTQSKSSNRVFYTQIHGINHKNADGSSRQKIIKDCYEAEEMVLVPEPDNPVDPDAVKICRKSGEQLGYWEGDGRMAHDLAIGWTYRVTIDGYSYCRECVRERLLFIQTSTPS